MDIDKLVDEITKEIMRRLNSEGAAKVVAFGDVPQDLLRSGYNVVKGSDCADVAGCDYIVMTAASFAAFHGGAAAPVQQDCAACSTGTRVIDLTNKRLLHERDLRDHNAQNGDVVKVANKTIITALAQDYARGNGIKITKGD